jgi:hypothetical protein
VVYGAKTTFSILSQTNNSVGNNLLRLLQAAVGWWLMAADASDAENSWYVRNSAARVQQPLWDNYVGGGAFTIASVAPSVYTMLRLTTFIAEGGVLPGHWKSWYLSSVVLSGICSVAIRCVCVAA